MGDFRWDDVDKVNVKETLMIHLKDGEVRRIELDDLDFMKRYACRYCADYTAEFADISFGGIGAEKGWTTVLIRTPLGRAVFADARGKDLEELTHKESPKFASEAMNTVRKWSAKKKKAARENRRRLGKSHSFSQ
jgi:coenzyme F420 hydrogenase subunit beta